MSHRNKSTNNKEKDPNAGILTVEKVAASLSNLGHTPDGQLVYLRSQLTGLGLSTISVLGTQFTHLQSINLDRNKLTSLEGLKGLTHLVVLSAAHNHITAKGVLALIGPGRPYDDGSSKKGLIRFDPPYDNPLRRSLQRVILHHNKIENISCIRGFEYAYEIDVSHNDISGDVGEHAISMNSIGILNISNNRIQSIDDFAFDGCNSLQELNLNQNEISKVKFVSFLGDSLKTLRIAFNSIMECEAFNVLQKLCELDLSSNNIYDLGEVSHLSACRALRILQLEGNPVMKEAPTTKSTTETENNENATGSRTVTVRQPGVSAETGREEGEDFEAAATDEAEDEKLKHRLVGYEVDNTVAGGRIKDGSTTATTKGNSKAARDLASMAARRHQQGSIFGHNQPPREAVATPFNSMHSHLSRQKELNMDVANVIRRTAQLLRNSQENDNADGRDGNESIKFSTSDNLFSSKSLNQKSKGASSITHTLGGQSGASTMLLTPEEEDILELQQLSAEQQTRLKVLWRLPSVAMLDKVAVTPEELALAQCLTGGTDRKQRQEAKDRAFGISQNNPGASRSQYVAAGGATNAINSLRRQ